MKIYIVMVNGDMTEGRGPMCLEKVSLDKAEAVSYIESKEGVFGSHTRHESLENRPYYAHGGKKLGTVILYQNDRELIEVEA